MGKNIILVGGFSEMIELCEDCNFNIVGIIDKPSSYHSKYPILGQDSDASTIFNQYKNCEIVLSPDQPSLRKKLFHLYHDCGFQFASVISPKANISRTAKIGKGCVIQHGCNISSNSVLGDFIKLNVNANIMHDNQIGSFTTIAPNAVLLGRVKIGNSAYIGANSTILPEKAIDSFATVGAGAVVTKNVERGGIVKGVPAK